MREFAGYDSVRAFVPLAGLEIWEGDILKAADLIKRADESGMEVAGKQAMREKVREYAYYYFDEYLKEMLPKSNSAMTDEELDAAVSFRKEGDEVCRMLGYDPVALSNWRFNELSSQAYYRWYEKGHIAAVLKSGPCATVRPWTIRKTGIYALNWKSWRNKEPMFGRRS